MSSEANKALIRRYMEEVVNGDNREVARQILAADAVNHVPGLPEPLRGLDGDAQLNGMFRGAFPDARLTIEDILGEGDTVVTRLTYRGTHTGEFQGLPPTGRRFTMNGLHVAQIREGRIAEVWSMPDLLGLMQQLGAIPTGG